MPSSFVDAYRPSRVMLGTVQFGIPYGVANRTGQPAYREVVAILEQALQHGVNCLDTAAAYGTSEEVIGRALRELQATERMLVVTKVRPLSPEEACDASRARIAIEQSVDNSRSRLGLDRLPLVLFHRECDATHAESLMRLRDRGWISHAGVSCDHDPQPARSYLAADWVSALQVPGNVLDGRQLKSGILELATARETAIFVRSVYLQGLLVMPEENIPAALRGVVPVRRPLAELAQDAGLSLAELALRYLLSMSGVTSVLIGIESVSQLRSNLDMAARGPLEPNLLQRVEALIPNLPELLITPRLWPNPPTPTGR